jgi:hypothetical protein
VKHWFGESKTLFKEQPTWRGEFINLSQYGVTQVNRTFVDVLHDYN